MNCPSCDKGGSCKLQSIASKLGVSDVRFRRTREKMEIDDGSPALIRDPNKCILCGDCVRYCDEIQGIGAIDFAYRGEDVRVTPAFNKSLSQVDCVNCGQCAAVCPTGAIVPRSEIDEVWKLIEDEDCFTAVQIAPAIRTALGEMFGMPGQDVTGRIVSALRKLGFDRVYSTAFGADLTVMEESNEFLERKKNNGKLPLFTSCCPGWVKFAEQSYPQLLDNLSTCMSPQSMTGSIGREILAGDKEIGKREIKMVSVMPCTAKKFEKGRDELSRDGKPLVDNVLTTQELGKMIMQAGIQFPELDPSSMDLPMSSSSGAGSIFGRSGGVAQAVIRYTAESAGEKISDDVLEGEAVDGNQGIRVMNISLGGESLKVCTVQGLKNADIIARSAAEGKCEYDLIEVMACPGGCVGGAGQPVDIDGMSRVKRTAALDGIDRREPVKNTAQNPFIDPVYSQYLGGKPGSSEAHTLLHTTYSSRKRIQTSAYSLIKSEEANPLEIKVCVGTSCFLKGSQHILSDVIAASEDEDFAGRLSVQASFCREKCDKGPTVRVGNKTLNKTNTDEVLAEIKKSLVKI
jgi:NADH-quinone oxidoreductase subunit G